MPQVPAESQEDGLIAASAPNHVVRPATRTFDESLLEKIRLPDGFRIGVFARGFDNPRGLAADARGRVYVADRKRGEVVLLADTNGDGRADLRRVVAEGLGRGLAGVHGLTVHDGHLFMVTETELYAARIDADGLLSPPRKLRDDIPSGGQHPNRTLAFGPDGKLYLSVGSTCNACPEPNPWHATLLRLERDGSGAAVFAKGLRNTIGFAWHPTTGKLYGFDHNSDGRGDDEHPEELNALEEGKHYGWPWCYGDRRVDYLVAEGPEQGARGEFCKRTEPPVLTYQGHAAPMALVYYTATRFPAEYRNDAFATMRGSWNRNPPVGYEIVRVRHDERGAPVAVEPFATGWLLDGGRAHFGRLMGLALAHDGSLIVGDDANGVLYRIDYGR